MAKPFSHTLAIAFALLAPIASHAQLRISDNFDPYPTLSSPLLQSLYLSAEQPPSSLTPIRLSPYDRALADNKSSLITLGLRLSATPPEAPHAYALVLAATLGGTSLSGQCHIYTLAPCQSAIPSTLSELVRIRTLSLTYRLRY